MKPAGGLKLKLEPQDRADRRLRFADVTVQAVDGEERLTLVTDSRGRLRYRLPAGAYVLRSERAPGVRFTVSEHGWTTVRLRLP